MLLPRLRARFSRDAVVAGASVLYALAALGLAYVQNLGLLAVAMLAKGAAWIAILSALQVSAQFALPEWVRARGLAAFVVVLMGGMALGSILWGQVATAIGIPAALTTAALGMVAAVAATWRFKLGDHAVRDFTPSMDWPAPVLAETPEPDSGPVMVTIEYRIRPDKRAEFVAAMQEVREMRRRNGAFFWQLLHDSAAPARYVEYFMDESWLEHLRQHERASVADRETLQRAKQFLVAGESSSHHALAARPATDAVSAARVSTANGACIDLQLVASHCLWARLQPCARSRRAQALPTRNAYSSILADSDFSVRTPCNRYPLARKARSRWSSRPNTWPIVSRMRRCRRSWPRPS